MKHLHLLFVILTIGSFVARILLAEFKPAILQTKLFKIAPHVIDTILLLSGLGLAISGGWFSGDFAWIINKVVLLVAYVVLGVVAMRSSGMKRWIAFVGALLAFAVIGMVAVTKQGLI